MELAKKTQKRLTRKERPSYLSGRANFVSCLLNTIIFHQITPAASVHITMTDSSKSTTSAAAVEASQEAASAMSTAAAEECTDCSPPTAVSDGLEASQSAATAMDTSQPAAENLMDPSTFIPPLDAVQGLPTPLVVIEVSVLLPNELGM